MDRDDGEDASWWSAGLPTLDPPLRKSVDLNVPNAARIWDYMLGGKDNFAVDRQVVDQMINAVPDVLTGPRTIRGSLRRAVHHMVTEAGIDQFLDLGSGLPTEDNVHQVAQRLRPQAQVVYVDNDPTVAVHGNALLAGHRSTSFINADLCDVDTVLGDPEVRRLIDSGRPIGLIMCAVLEYVLDKDDPVEVVAAYSAAMPPGSHLFIVHVCVSGHPGSDAMEKIFSEFHGQLRTREQVTDFFTGWDLVEPGVVPIISWRPGTPASAEVPLSHQALVGGLARK